MRHKKLHNIFIFAGEYSGDLHGSYLLKKLRSKSPDLSVDGVPGPTMRNAGVNSQVNLRMEDFSVMGITDVLKALPKLYKNFILIRDHIIKTAPDAAVLIDYPGFNLRMAKALRKKGYKGKIIQYISPSVWAHSADRIETMTSTLDMLMTIYPFEEKYFTDSTLPVTYVGNPLCEYIKHHKYKDDWQASISMPRSEHIIALFPGSRSGEISRNLPLMLEAARKYKKQHPEAVFAISCVNPNEIQKYLYELKDVYTVPREFTYELMRDCRTAIAKSGTVVLELALHRRPTVVIYKLSSLNRFYAKYILNLKLPYYCIANILAGKEVFPELIAAGVDPEQLFHQLERIDNDGTARYECMRGCSEIRDLLGDTDASSSAAEMVMRVSSC